MKVTADSYIAEVLAGKVGAAEVFAGHGSHCLTCGNAPLKTVAGESHECRAHRE